MCVCGSGLFMYVAYLYTVMYVHCARLCVSVCIYVHMKMYMYTCVCVTDQLEL